MKRIGAVLSVLALPFGVVLVFVLAGRALLMGHLEDDARAMDDTWSPRPAVLEWAWIWSRVYNVPWPLTLAILHNEGASAPTADGTYPVGDSSKQLGPSYGPGQVLRANIERLATTTAAKVLMVSVGDASELARVGQERKALWYAVQILRDAWQRAEGDAHEAAAQYNGGPRHFSAAATAYADRAVDAMRKLGSPA